MIYNPQGYKMMLCLREQFYSLKILSQPREGMGAGLVFVDNFFSYKTKNKTKFLLWIPNIL